MSWYVLDAVDHAMERTRTCLIEPFDIWKWMKLALIVFFVGGAAGFNGGNSGSYGDSYDGSDPDISWIPPGIQDIVTDAGHFVSEYLVTVIAGFISMLLLYAIIMGLVGAVMEFVFVESLVRNDVRLREYFSRYLGSGIALFFLRILLLMLLMVPIVIFALIFYSLVAAGGEGDSSVMMMVLLIPLIFVAVILFIVAAGIVESFINIAIPVSIYTGNGIFSSLSNVFGQFRQEWKQMVIYWVGRAVLLIATAIVLAILGLIGLIFLGIVLLVIDAVVYFALMIIVSETTVWLTFIPILIIEFIIISLFMAFIGMPVKVFLKYHMLTFLSKWYPIEIPFFDMNAESLVQNMQIE